MVIILMKISINQNAQLNSCVKENLIEKKFLLSLTWNFLFGSLLKIITTRIQVKIDFIYEITYEEDEENALFMK